MGREYLIYWLPAMKNLTDTGIAMMAGVVLFVLPTDWQKGAFVLDWKDTEKMPWGILLLFGGGICLANALETSGIIQLIGKNIAAVKLSPFWINSILIVVVVFMTEVMSNVALTVVFLPVVGAMAVGMGQNPLLFTIPATIAASCAFMLPMATPPNAIVFSGGYIRIAEMAKVGFWMNLVSILLLILFSHFLLKWVFAF
jgi:sodium-dependent dicarboxylate transporter 2/3/5